MLICENSFTSVSSTLDVRYLWKPFGTLVSYTTGNFLVLDHKTSQDILACLAAISEGQPLDHADISNNLGDIGFSN